MSTEQQEELQPSAPRRPIIYDELFYNWVPPDPTMAMCMALCAVADEVRALRLAVEDAEELSQYLAVKEKAKL